MSFPDGDSYEGDWIEGNREGFGTHRYASGQVYIGEWKNGKHHGNPNQSLNFQERESLLSQMEIPMTVIGLRVKQKVLAPTVQLTKVFTSVNGRMAKNMVLQTQV